MFRFSRVYVLGYVYTVHVFRLLPLIAPGFRVKNGSSRSRASVAADGDKKHALAIIYRLLVSCPPSASSSTRRVPPTFQPDKTYAHAQVYVTVLEDTESASRCLNIHDALCYSGLHGLFDAILMLLTTGRTARLLR